MRESLIVEALTMAVSRRNDRPGLLLRSDRGVQERGNEYQDLISECKMQPSMSRNGNCRDYAVMESFFSRLKVELIHPEIYRAVDERRSGLVEYIETSSHRQRRHHALGYLGPDQFESPTNHENVSAFVGNFNFAGIHALQQIERMPWSKFV